MSILKETPRPILHVCQICHFAWNRRVQLSSGIWVPEDPEQECPECESNMNRWALPYQSYVPYSRMVMHYQGDPSYASQAELNNPHHWTLHINVPFEMAEGKSFRAKGKFVRQNAHKLISREDIFKIVLEIAKASYPSYHIETRDGYHQETTPFPLEVYDVFKGDIKKYQMRSISANISTQTKPSKPSKPVTSSPSSSPSPTQMEQAFKQAGL